MAEKCLVISGKGGVGKSTLTVGLARALCRRGKKVLLIDGDIGLRSLDLLLQVGVQAVFSWLDVCENRCDAESAVLKGDANTPALLTAPASLPADFTAERFKGLLAQYENKYDFIFIDAPAGLGGMAAIAAPACERTFVVAVPDAVSIRAAGTAANDVLTNGGKENLRLLINRFDKKEMQKSRDLDVDDIIERTSVRLLGILPEDKSLRQMAAGAPMSRKARDAFLRVADRICGREVPLKI